MRTASAVWFVVLLVAAGCSTSAVSEPAPVVDAVVASPQTQQEASDDSRVTFEEYQQAAFDTVECIRDEGIEAEMQLSKYRTYGFIVEGYEEDEAAQARVDAATWGCMAIHMTGVSERWQAQTLDPDREQKFDQIIIDCLGENGIEADDSMFAEVLEAHEDLFNMCTQRAIDADTGS